MTNEEIIEYLKRQYSADVAAYDWYSSNIGQPFAEGPVGRAISKALEPAKRFARGYMGDTVDSGPAYELGKLAGTPHPLNLAAAPKMALKGASSGVLGAVGMMAAGTEDFPKLSALTKRYRSLGKADQKTMRGQLEAEGLVVDPSTDHVSHWFDPRKIQTNIPSEGKYLVKELIGGPEAERMFDQRPDLADIPVLMVPGSGGNYTPPNDIFPDGRIMLGAGSAVGSNQLWTPEKTLFHELQHAGYGQELYGGNPQMFSQMLGHKLWTPSVKLSTYRNTKPLDEYVQAQGVDPKKMVDPFTGAWSPEARKAISKWERAEEKRGAIPEDTTKIIELYRGLALEGDITRGLRNPKRHERLVDEILVEGKKMQSFYQSIGAIDQKTKLGDPYKAYTNVAGEVAANFTGEYPHFMLTNPDLKDMNPYDVFPIWTRARGHEPIGWDDIMTRYQNTTGYDPKDLPNDLYNVVNSPGMLK